MCQYLPYDDIKFDNKVKLDDNDSKNRDNILLSILNTPDDSQIGYFVECDLSYSDNIKEKTKNFSFCPGNKISLQDKFSNYMNEIKPDNYTPCKKLICDFTDKENYSLHYRMLTFYIKHGMIVDKVHEIISFKQSKWLNKYIDFHAKRRALATNDFKLKFHKDMPNSFYGKTMENIRNRIKVEFIRKDDNEKIIKQQSKLTFNGIHKSYEKYDSYTFKQNEILMDKPIYLGFSVVELNKLHMYETYYDILQPYFGQESLQLQYMDTDSFVLSVNTKI